MGPQQTFPVCEVLGACAHPPTGSYRWPAVHLDVRSQGTDRAVGEVGSAFWCPLCQSPLMAAEDPWA